MNPAHELLAQGAIWNDSAKVREAISRGADINDSCYGPGTKTALQLAAESHATWTFQYLLEQGADVNLAPGTTAPVLSAVFHRADPPLELVRAALEAGAHVNAAPHQDSQAIAAPPICLAAWTGSMDVVRLLLAHGADPELRSDKNGQIALQWALLRTNSPVLFHLACVTRDIDARDNEGKTALCVAVDHKMQTEAACLLALGASPTGITCAHDKLNKLLQTPALECAVMTREPQIVIESLRRREDVSDDEIECAVKAARRRKLPVIESLLRSVLATHTAHRALGDLSKSLAP